MSLYKINYYISSLSILVDNILVYSVLKNTITLCYVFSKIPSTNLTI